MCGIFGAINFNGLFSKKDFQLFSSLTDMVAYRGPDASGYQALNLKQDLSSEDQFDVFIGHRRLSIIDLSNAANQPLTDGAGRWIVFNGEIFNYIELRDDLIKEGQYFKTASDTEVILGMYKKYGEEGFVKLNGMWAFAIVDCPRKRIILSRDRFSIKPLYYIQRNGGLYFSSEIKQILPFLPAKKINDNNLFAYLSQGLTDHNEESFFQGVCQVAAKYNFVIDMEKGGLEKKRYWNYSADAAEGSCNLSEAIEIFRELFLDSLKIRLRSDVEIGALLSGGLDSSTITIGANEFQNGKLSTFSVISDDKKFSEERFIDLLCRNKQIRNRKLTFRTHSEDLQEELETVLYHHDEPFGGFSTLAHFKLLELLKKNSGLKVVLSGQGGDEILMGYLKYFFFNIKDLVKERHYFYAFKELLFSFLQRTVLWQFRLSTARRYIPFFATNRNHKYYLRINGPFESVWRYSSLRERQLLDIDKYSVSALTHYEDRTSMAHSLEIRLPFLDHRLVNFLVNLPVRLKIHNGWSKYILRKSMKELPEAIRWRRDKQGFSIPEETWLKTDLRGMIERLFSKSRLHEMGIIEDRFFLEYYRRFRRGAGAIWYSDISRVLIAELWVRKFFDKT